jgi:hypothetical protein
MKLSTPGDVASRAAALKISKILWNLKDYYRDHKTPILVCIRRQINPLHTTSYYLSEIQLKYSST